MGGLLGGCNGGGEGVFPPVLSSSGGEGMRLLDCVVPPISSSPVVNWGRLYAGAEPPSPSSSVGTRG